MPESIDNPGSDGDDDDRIPSSRFLQVPVYGDGRCFFRCLAISLYSELQDSDRLDSGLISGGSGLNQVEKCIADDLRKAVVATLQKESKLLSDLSASFSFILDNTFSTKFATVHDRIEYMSRSGSFVGNLELLTGGFFLNAQMHIYQEIVGQSQYKLVAKLPTYHFTTQQPILLLNKVDKEGEPGHFSLLFNRDATKIHKFQQFSVSTTVGEVLKKLQTSCEIQFMELFSHYKDSAIQQLPSSKLNSSNKESKSEDNSQKQESKSRPSQSPASPSSCSHELKSMSCQEKSTTDVLDATLLEKPNQPPSSAIATQILSNKSLKFQDRWFELYPWLHYVDSLQGVLCIVCATAYRLKLLDLSKYAEGAFMIHGFKNWKKALEKFKAHGSSAAHRHATMQLQHQKSALPIESMISDQVLRDQAMARKCLHILFTTLKFLGRQGLAIRGHDDDEGNFKQLLLLRCDDQPSLTQWLAKKTNMTSHEIQNEILQLQAHAVIRILCDAIRTSQIFSVIVDGTQDVSGVEQESICIRYVDTDLRAHEVFVGMYESPDSTGKTIANIVVDALIRLQLPIEFLRGQTYDGAANMSGAYHGCQAEIKTKQPLALYVHCGAHSTNLVASNASSSVAMIRDALQWVQELGTFYGASGKYRKIFASVASDEQSSNLHAIKPLCPTRWLTRCSAVKSVLEKYPDVLASLDEASDKMTGDAALHARSLRVKFELGTTVLGLLMALPALEKLESLNKALQDQTTCVSGMLAVVNIVVTELDTMRKEVYFSSVFQNAVQMIKDNDLNVLKLPRRRQPPARYSGPAENYQAKSELEHYRPLFFEYIDCIKSDLEKRFQSNDLKKYMEIEDVLLHGESSDILKQYHELDVDSLMIQLQMFRHMHTVKSVVGAADCVRDLKPEVRRLFPQVEQLIRLLLISPASSAEAERSFSSLRRLKTWLRSTIDQSRLNSVAVCHTHKNILDSLNLVELEEQFILRSDIRKNLFGSFAKQ